MGVPPGLLNCHGHRWLSTTQLPKHPQITIKSSLPLSSSPQTPPPQSQSAFWHVSVCFSDYGTISHLQITLLFRSGDPLLRSLETTIVSASLLEPSPPSSVKKGGHTKKTKASSVPTFPHPVLQLVLHDTVIFPEGGGQPFDIGILTSEDGAIWSVECVKRDGGVAVHYVKPAEDISDVPDVFAPGKRVNLELGHTGFQRRLDHVSPPSLFCPSHTHVVLR